MRKKILSTLLFTAMSLGAYSQDTIVKKKSTFDKGSIGVGFGMDYGGIGVNAMFYPQKNIGLFGGLGYNLNELGYNVGVKLRLVNDKRPAQVSPFLLGMYGYNAVINVENASQFNRTFYGPTVGIGLDYKSYPTKKGYWTFALLVPIRNSDVDDYMDDLRENHNVDFKNGLLPVGFSVGYRFIID